MATETVDIKRIIAAAENCKDEMTDLRRDFHSRPELSWREVETSKKIEKKLEELGFENIRRGFRDTESGVVAEITGSSFTETAGRADKNDRSAGGSGAGKPLCVALRGDLDALPIQEETGLPFASTEGGVMHACGHDAHTAILLGAARILSQLQESFSGKVRLLFQPAEEIGFDSGAPALIDEGALDNVDAIAGLHVWAGLPLGTFGIRSGALMASADLWKIMIQGQGGHGAKPHQAVDPTVAAAHLISMMQTVVSREIDPLDSAVLSVGSLTSGSAPNVIPDKTEITGNIRTTNPRTRSEMEDRLLRMIGGVSDALRCTAELSYTPTYPVTVNDARMTELFKKTAALVLGEENIREIPISMGSEDFSYYGEKVPAVFGMLGMGDPEEGTDRTHHSPHFKTHEEVLVPGASLLSAFALNFLAGGSAGSSPA
ncbi:MAG: M20 family metallopeptidase [Spirochaetia bacterium]